MWLCALPNACVLSSRDRASDSSSSLRACVKRQLVDDGRAFVGQRRERRVGHRTSVPRFCTSTCHVDFLEPRTTARRIVRAIRRGRPARSPRRDVDTVLSTILRRTPDTDDQRRLSAACSRRPATTPFWPRTLVPEDGRTAGERRRVRDAHVVRSGFSSSRGRR